MATTRDASGCLMLGGVRLADIARDPAIGTPTYVYDVDAIAREALEINAAFEGAPSSHLIAYAVKANAAGPIVRALAKLGCGADVVSGGELELARLCGIAPSKIVFSGVAKTDDEIDRALKCGDVGIGAIQAESVREIARIDDRARAIGKIANVGIRINPELAKDSIGTHSHVATGHDDAKFGIPRSALADAIARIDASPHVRLVGIAAHIGSQLKDVDAYVDAARVLFSDGRVLREKYGASFEFVDTGGGFGVDYGDGQTTRPADFIRAVLRERHASGLDDLAIHIEPGRSIVATHGVLLAREISQRTFVDPKTGKIEKTWLMIDAGMNDLLRPALYQARHRIVRLQETSANARAMFRVVGPVCESSDDFGEYDLAVTDEASGDVAILDAGAYGYSMASRYNGRAMPAEVFVIDRKIGSISYRKPMDDWAIERANVGS